MTAPVSVALPADLAERWAAARLWAAHHAPYLTTAVLALRPRLVDTEDAGDEGVDATALRALPVDERWHVHVHPQVLLDLPTPEAGFWLLHQVGHLLRGHAQRFLARYDEQPRRAGSEQTPTQRRWGLAADCEIDDDLPADCRVPTAVLPDDLGLPDGGAVEGYDDELARRPTLPVGVDCGSGRDGRRRTWDGPEPGLSAGDVALLRREVAQAAASHARLGGDVPPGWLQWAQELLEPTVPWRRELAAAVRRAVAVAAGNVDYSYRRPSRRQQAVSGVVLPRLHQPVPQVAVVLDTSASMTPELLSRAVAELGGVLKAVGVTASFVRVLCCDTAARDVGLSLGSREVTLIGGGGTDLRKGLRAALSGRPRPDLVVLLTDGWTDWPEEAPRGCTVIVGLLDDAPAPPPWARVVRVPERG